MPIFWECDRCAACCRWPGQVWLTDADVTRIASYRQLTEAEFIPGHTRLNAQHNGLALLD
jgi:Fe-S-cluster containining protein